MIEELLPRYCEGDVTEEEKQLVEEWIARSDENYRIVRQIYTIYLAADTLHVLDKGVDTEKALANVSSRMSKSGHVSWFIWMQRIAAVLFIPVLITLLMQNFNSEELEAQMIEMKTNPGMTTTFSLPDGTVVYLNSESSLSYPSRFDGKTRGVVLRGEAFFSVMKDHEKRFIVSTPHGASVEVLGTVFNVEAFPKDSIISTTLVEGKVSFVYNKRGQSESHILTQGQKLVYNSNNQQVTIKPTAGVSETAWKDGKIIFSDTPLPKALRMLEKRYNVEFVITSRRFEGDSFSGSFKHQRLDRILEVFKVSSGIKWRYLDSKDASDIKTKIEIY